MATLITGAAIAAATALSADPASGAAPTASALPQFCGRGTLALFDQSGGAPTLTRPGDYASVPVTLRNTSRATVTDARLILTVSDDRGRHTALAPALRWRLDAGPWHQVALHKTFTRGYASDPMGLPRVGPGSTHTLRLSAAFRSGSLAGSYTVRASLRAGHCATYLGFAQASYRYAPTQPPAAKPSPKPHKHSAGTKSPEPAPTTAGHPPVGTAPAAPAQHPTPSPSASTPTPSASSPAPLAGPTTIDGGPVAPIPTDAAADRALTDPIAGASRAALIIGGVGSLFIGGATLALMYLRRRRLS